MKSVLSIAAILAILCTIGFTIMMLVLCIAGSANSSDQQLRSIKVWALVFCLIAVAGVVGGGWLMYVGRPGWAAGVGILPAVIMFVTFVIKTL